jgi:PiT family inorganic phosphate transporter
MTIALGFVIFIIIIALVFDYINGFHDAANSIATVVSTRVLSPGMAVVWAAFFNFIAFAIFGTRVAKTIGGDLVNINLITADMRLYVLLAALLGAIIWNIITWWLGLPTSSSHALVGAYAGAAIASYKGFSGLLIASGWIKTLAFIVASPLIGLVLGYTFMVIVYWLFRRSSPNSVDKIFRRGQLFSAAAFSLGHGGNDAQKTMGIIAVLLFSQGYLGSEFYVPLWVVITCQAAMALGTLFGGWRIVHTMGSKITRLTPMQGFCAETGGALTLFGATYLGIPVSTTHTITGAIIGVGSARRTSAVRWGVARGIVVAWVVTIPASAAIAAFFYHSVAHWAP